MKKQRNQEDLLIKALNYGKDNPDFKIRDLLQYLDIDEGTPFTRWLLQQIRNNSLFKGDNNQNKSDGSILLKNYEFNLSVEDYMNLLEYHELQEARESSKKAMRRSTTAMIISSVLAMASIVIPFII